MDSGHSWCLLLENFISLQNYVYERILEKWSKFIIQFMGNLLSVQK